MAGAGHIRRAPPGVVEAGERRHDAGRSERWSAWMAAAQEGDGRRYEALLHEVRPVVQAYVRKRLPGDAAVEDVVQTVLLLIHRARHSYRAERPFEPWLFAIAKNALRDHQRRGGRRARREETLRDDLRRHADPDAPGDRARSASPESGAIARELERALAKLPASQREAVTLLHLEGLSVDEAAQRVGTTRGALKARIHRAYVALRALLAGDAT